MAGSNNFMNDKGVQALLYGISAAFCLFYSVDAVRDLISPERNTLLIEQVGSTAFYALTVLRLVALLWAGIAFARMVWKLLQARDE